MAANQEQAVVTAEDQQMINKFARLHQNFQSLGDEMKELLNDVQNLNEAADEIMLLGDDEAVPIKMGTTFIHFDQNEAGLRLEKMKGEAETLSQTKKTEKDVIEAEMKRLKTVLYGKFGDRINLESEQDD